MTDILMPLEEEGTKAIVRAWLKQVGDAVKANEPLVEVETDKVTVEVPAPADGVLAEILLSAEAEAAPGAVLGRLSDGEARTEATAGSAPAPAERLSNGRPVEPEHRLSPAVRRAVRQHGIDLTGLNGTGRGGRITRADVDKLIAERVAGPAEQPPAARSIPHDRMRRLIADNMLNSVTTAPHVTAVFEADFGAIIAHRGRHKADFAREGVNLTFTAYFVAASVAAMRVAPAINSRWHEDRLELFDDVNIGVGTALGDKGLVVPVVHKAQSLSLIEIARRLQDLIGRARHNRLTTADVKGGTFSISNHGVSGSLVATPIIITQPQSAILGVGKLEKRVVVREVDGVDSIQIRPRAYVSLTIDHRVVDGHQTNAWLTRFVETIESWPIEG